MANQAPKAAASDEQPVAAVPLTLDEFCVRLSETVRSPEAIGAFHHTERAAGRMVDTEAAYRARFDSFLTTPI